MAVNVGVIRLSRGHIGSRLGTQDILLLHSYGNKTGKHRVTPIAYFHIGNYYFLVGSNWGRDQDAGWYHNLLAQPRTLIEVKGRKLSVEASPAEGQEYDRLWKYAVEHHPPYLKYQEMTRRRIPIVVLEPVE